MNRQRERVPGEGFVAGRGPDPIDEGDSDGAETSPLVGVLAVQGDVLEHLRLLRAAGARVRPVKHPADLDGLDGVLLPGGESTTIGKLAQRYGLFGPLRERLGAGLPAFGTCAGAILLGRAALHHDGRPADQPLLGSMDTVLRRNAFGRQVASFEADLSIDGITGGPVRAVFIRAPWVEQAGSDVEVLATVATSAGDKVVVVRQGNLIASAFHPELSGDGRLHRLFVASLTDHSPIG